MSDSTFAADRIFATDAEKLEVAKAEAFRGLAEGGIPIGAVLVHRRDHPERATLRPTGAGASPDAEIVAKVT